MEELKNCGHCGGKAKIYGNGAASICCDWQAMCECGISTKWFKKIEDARLNWNTRTPSSSNGLDREKVRNIVYKWNVKIVNDVDRLTDAIIEEFKQTSENEVIPEGMVPCQHTGGSKYCSNHLYCKTKYYAKSSPSEKQTSGLDEAVILLTRLVQRIDHNGGLGEYKGGPSFVMKAARDFLNKQGVDI